MEPWIQTRASADGDRRIDFPATAMRIGIASLIAVLALASMSAAAGGQSTRKTSTLVEQTGTITGRVVRDVDGKPVADAIVHALPFNTPADPIARAKKIRTTQTNTADAFQFDNLPPQGRFTLKKQGVSTIAWLRPLDGRQS